MIQRVALCIICLLVLSACDSGDTAPSNVATNNISSDSYDPIDLDNALENISGMVISGALNHNSGDVPAFSLPVDLGGDEVYRYLEVESRNGYIVRLVHHYQLPAGTYPITTQLGTFAPRDEFAAGLLNLWSPDPTVQYTLNPQGTVTIRYEGDFTAGMFSFTAENSAGESVTVDGQFYAREVDSIVR